MTLVFGRLLRDTRSLVLYPFWLASNRPPPDSHIRKRQRIIELGRKYSCRTFIETGTFYGQMVNVARKHFERVISVELFEPLYQLNRKAFAGYPHVTVLQGDSSTLLEDMLALADGRILFWLDGHYSGSGTACSGSVSPIIAELETIKSRAGGEHCILIDDARLFTGTGGYPTLAETRRRLLEINDRYGIQIDGDCVVAVPPLQPSHGVRTTSSPASDS